MGTRTLTQRLRNYFSVITFCLCLFAWAGDSVSLRWVKATDKAMRGQDVRLEDVEPTLRKKLPYKSYLLVSLQNLELQGAQSVNLEDGFVVRFSGSQDNLQIIVERNDKEFLNTTVNLQNDKPLIVGGFPANDSGAKFMLVLKAK